MRSTSTIDKLYDQYKLQDWDINADNLNPKREMLMGQVKQIEKAIQSLTDDIVRKRITPTKKDIETLTTSFGGESTVGNLGKTIASINKSKKSKDDVQYLFKNGSRINILAAKESSRG